MSGAPGERPRWRRLVILPAVLVLAAGGGLGMAAWAAESIPAAAGESAGLGAPIPADAPAATAPPTPSAAPALASSVHYASLRPPAPALHSDLASHPALATLPAPPAPAPPSPSAPAARPSPTLSPIPPARPVPVFPGFRVAMGAEEVVAGPVADHLDSRLLTMPAAGGLVAYLAGTATYAFPASIGFPAAGALAGQAVLEPGPAGRFDECAARLQSAVELTAAHWVGWYDAEAACDDPAGAPRESVAFAESFDAGRTWQKTGYPANQVVTAPARAAGDPLLDRAGDARVVRQGSYLYMLYAGGDHRTYLARSPVAAEGRPGTWRKYHGGTWSEPGIGGRQAAIGAGAGGLAFDTYLGAGLDVSVSARQGFSLRVSAGTDLTSWEEAWSGGDVPPGFVYRGVQPIGLDGNGALAGRSFYLYYLERQAGDGSGPRQLVRRRVELTLRPDP